MSVRPAWSLTTDARESIDLPSVWPAQPSRDWAFGGSTGRGSTVCILDSGVDPSHPLVGALAAAVAVETGPDGSVRVVPDELGDVCGHGTACAGVVRSLAPECDLVSVRVLGAGATGSGELILALVVVGIGNSLVDINAVTLLQRIVPNDILGRVVGVVEGVVLACIGIDSAAAPLLVDAFGARTALIVVGAVLPLLTLVMWPRLRGIDGRTTPPPHLDLLARVEIFASLPCRCWSAWRKGSSRSSTRPAPR